MAYFQTENRNSGKLQWKMLVYFTAMWSILRSIGIFCDHLVYFMVIWYILSRFGMLYQEQSGNPASVASRQHDQRETNECTIPKTN
jgi:preprotein translocase subunit SecY